jgi:hypothetical protein
MPGAADDAHYTYNELTNEDKELLLAHGYKPGELPPEEERELVQDLRNQTAGDEDSDRLSTDIIADERDGTQ